MIDYSSAYPNSIKTYDERDVRLTPDGPAATLRVPVREVALTLSGTGTSVELRVPKDDPAGMTTPPLESDGDWRSVAEQSQAGDTATLRPDEPVTPPKT